MANTNTLAILFQHTLRKPISTTACKMQSWNSASKCHTVSINFGVSYLVMYQQDSLVTTHKYTLSISRTIQKKNLKPKLNS